MIQILIGLFAILAAFGAGWHFGERGPVKELSALKATILADNARRKEQADAREAEYEQARQGLAEAARVAQRERDAAEATAGKVRKDLAAVLRDMRSLRDSCPVAAPAVRVWNDAAGARADPQAEVRPAEASSAEAAPAAPSSNCLAVYETGVENTLAARFNADEVNRCWRYAVPLWEACTGQRFNYATEAPWLLQGER